MTSLRDTTGAERLRHQAQAAFEAHSSTEHVDPVLASVDEGLCMLWDSDPGGASQHVMDVLAALPAGHGTGLVRVYASAFVASLTPAQRRLRAAVDLEESLRAMFAAAPAG